MSADRNTVRNSCARQSQVEKMWEEDFMKEAREKIRSNIYIITRLEQKIRRLETQLTEQLKTVVQNSNKIFRM